MGLLWSWGVDVRSFLGAHRYGVSSVVVGIISLSMVTKNLVDMGVLGLINGTSVNADEEPKFISINFAKASKDVKSFNWGAAAQSFLVCYSVRHNFGKKRARVFVKLRMVNGCARWVVWMDGGYVLAKSGEYFQDTYRRRRDLGFMSKVVYEDKYDALKAAIDYENIIVE